jgi:hypothetical protein
MSETLEQQAEGERIERLHEEASGGAVTGTRIGRWVFSEESIQYGEAGWHLDGSPVVIDFMPDAEDYGSGIEGCFLGYNWPGRHDCWEVSMYLAEAMSIVEQEWDEFVFAAIKG